MGLIKHIYKSLRQNDHRYFPTRNLHLATVLFAQNFTLVNVDRSDPANCEFVFRNSFDLEQMVELFNSKKPIFVEGRKFISSWKPLRGKVNGERF